MMEQFRISYDKKKAPERKLTKTIADRKKMIQKQRAIKSLLQGGCVKNKQMT